MSATMTAHQLETALRRALFNIRREDLPSARDARRTYGTVRAAHGFVNRPGLFLSDETDIAKLSAGIGRRTLALSLPPAASSGIAQLCAWSDHCVEPCVGTGGSNRYDSSHRGKVARLALLVDHPAAALALMVDGLSTYVRRYADIGVGMRLNTYSDIRWERILPAWFWELFSDVAFYDYTKHPIRSRPVETMPGNYRVTYSVSPRSTVAEISRQRDAGRSVAVVITTRGGKDRRTGSYRPAPVAVDGVRVVDGDIDDRRYKDPAGAVVLLRRKNGLGATDPLVVSDDRLGEILAE
jgi:hypothetical protein